LLNILEYPFVYQDENYIYLYKHQPITDSRLKLLTGGTISFTKPEKFNDPLDCVYAVDDSYHHSAEEVQNIFWKYCRINIAMEEAQKLAKQLKEIETKDINNLSYFQDINSRMGICCLNHNPLNILMWSHYADFHKGFLTEFKFHKRDMLISSQKYKNFLPIPIRYSNEMPLITLKDRLNPKWKILEIYTTKSEEWSYEKEFRILRPYTNEPIQKIPYTDLICTVIGGIKISSKDEEKLKKICSKNKIPYFRVERIFNNYGLTVPNHPRLDRTINETS